MSIDNLHSHLLHPRGPLGGQLVLLSTSIAAISSSGVVSAWLDGLDVDRRRFWVDVGRRQGFIWQRCLAGKRWGSLTLPGAGGHIGAFEHHQPELSLAFTCQSVPSKLVCGLTMLVAGVRRWQVGRNSPTSSARRWAAQEVWWVCLVVWLWKQPFIGDFLGQDCCLRMFTIVEGCPAHPGHRQDELEHHYWQQLSQ